MIDSVNSCKIYIWPLFTHGRGPPISRRRYGWAPLKGRSATTSGYGGNGGYAHRCGSLEGTAKLEDAFVRSASSWPQLLHSKLDLYILCEFDGISDD
jgi:hypothetical protein